MKVDFKKIKLIGLDGKAAKAEGGEKFHKTIATRIFYQIANLDLVEVARQINQGKAVELSKTDIKQIKACLLSEKAGFLAFAKEAITKFFDELEKQKDK